MIISVLMVSLFWLIGLVLMASAIHLGRRRTAFAVNNSRVFAIQSGLFGTKRREWGIDDLATVRVGPSGMETGDQPIMQVQFVPREGKPFGVLTGHEEPELEWVATVLRRALKTPNAPPNQAP